MRNLKKHLFLGATLAVLCLGAFVTTSSAQWRHGRSHFSVNFSIGTPYRYYPRYYRPVYRPATVYYRPAPVYYRPASVYYEPGYYNSGYYAPAYNRGYYVTTYRRRPRSSCNYYGRY